VEFELGWLAFGFLLGIGYLSTGPSPAVRALLPAWLSYVWAAAFLLGGLVGAWGTRGAFTLVQGERYWSLAAERAGHGLQAGAASTLGIAAVYVWLRSPDPDGPGPLTAPAFPVLALALVAVWMAVALRRIVRVTQILHTMTKHEHSEDGNDGDG